MSLMFMLLVGLVAVVCVAAVFFQAQVVAAVPVLATPLAGVRIIVLWCVEPVSLAFNWAMKPVLALVAKVKSLL
jgi:hypothetical protein